MPENPEKKVDSGLFKFGLSLKRKPQQQLRRREYTFLLEEYLNDTVQPDQVAPDSSDDDSPKIDELKRQLYLAEGTASHLRKQMKAKEAELTELRDLNRDLDDRITSKDKQIADAFQGLEDAKAHVQRSRQDMEQMKKRLSKEREELKFNASEDLLRQLFPILDNFQIAVESLDKNEVPDHLADGLSMIQREMLEVLTKNGFERISTSGEVFNPQIHEALSVSEDPDQPNNVVVKEYRPGYLLNGKVLRPAMVAVNKNFVNESEEQKPLESVQPEQNRERSPADTDFQPLDAARKMLDTRFE